MSTTSDVQHALDVLGRELRFARAEQRTVLHNVRWETLQRLLADRGDVSAPRFCYDRGALEIMSPSDVHEEFKETLTLLVFIACEESDADWRALGSFTHEREDLSRAVEPDGCFYIQNEARVRGKRIDLAVDPPPDLVVEIDITSSSVDKEPIYASLGVPELWRYDGRTFRILVLDGGSYREADRGGAFQWLPASRVAEALAAAMDRGQRQATSAFRAWARERLGRA